MLKGHNIRPEVAETDDPATIKECADDVEFAGDFEPFESVSLGAGRSSTTGGGRSSGSSLRRRMAPGLETSPTSGPRTAYALATSSSRVSAVVSGVDMFMSSKGRDYSGNGWWVC